MAISSTFQASGLASGLDTASLIDNLVKIQGATVTIAEKHQAAYTSQISFMADLVSKMTAFATATKTLTTSGTLALAQVGSASGFSATPSSAATAGRYSITVNELAQAARARSQGFASSAAPVTGGSLVIGVSGTDYTVAVDDGASLSTVAAAINSSGAPVTATVLNADGQSYLSITNRNTGFTPGDAPASALTITENSTGSLGQSLSAAIVQTATNAEFEIDGLSFERSSNTVADALPGVTLALSKKGLGSEDLVLQTSVTDTQANLQKFVDAYNAVMKAARGNMNIQAATDRDRTLGGDTSVRAFQSALLGLASTSANPSSSVRTLADIGIKTTIDGSLSIDAERLSKAITTDPDAVNALFQKASTGIGAAVDKLSTSYTNTVDGVFTNRTKGLNTSVKRVGKEIETLQLRLDKYRARLLAQFTAMETAVSKFKNIGSFLTLQEKSKSSD